MLQPAWQQGGLLYAVVCPSVPQQQVIDFRRSGSVCNRGIRFPAARLAAEEIRAVVPACVDIRSRGLSCGYVKQAPLGFGSTAEGA